MNDKQLGAAPKPQAETEQASGWFTRLRAQPGFRAATVAFVLTVILGVGGPAAYAYWSQSSSGAITGTTAYKLAPVLGVPDCTTRVGANRLTWAAVPKADMEADAAYLVTFERADNNRSVTLAVPTTTTELHPYNEHEIQEGLGATPGVELRVSVSTGLLTSGKPADVAKVERPAGIFRESAKTDPITLRYSAGITWITAAYQCR